MIRDCIIKVFSKNKANKSAKTDYLILHGFNFSPVIQTITNTFYNNNKINKRGVSIGERIA
ncbi:hypothetical protein BMETH_396_4 [methanotrophic bacterial endosymbiont of Bathymodiolus sp.]|nr:hypothetical protein BMETH_396_4 [methanotrophic bacterial endosymbiont of Bathymodiolus sp.]